MAPCGTTASLLRTASNPTYPSPYPCLHLSLCRALERIEGGAERLTELGVLLARLPIDARLGKLCVIGACFDGCLDDALTIAAALGTRSPFLSPIERRDEADRAKRAFATLDGPSACGASDVLARRVAYDAWDPAWESKRSQETVKP